MASLPKLMHPIKVQALFPSSSHQHLQNVIKMELNLLFQLIKDKGPYVLHSCSHVVPGLQPLVLLLKDLLNIDFSSFSPLDP